MARNNQAQSRPSGNRRDASPSKQPKGRSKGKANLSKPTAPAPRGRSGSGAQQNKQTRSTKGRTSK